MIIKWPSGLHHQAGLQHQDAATERCLPYCNKRVQGINAWDPWVERKWLIPAEGHEFWLEMTIFRGMTWVALENGAWYKTLQIRRVKTSSILTQWVQGLGPVVLPIKLLVPSIKHGNRISRYIQHFYKCNVFPTKASICRCSMAMFDYHSEGLHADSQSQSFAEGAVCAGHSNMSCLHGEIIVTCTKNQVL